MGGLNLGPTSTSATITGLTASTTYTFRVRSYNARGNCFDPPEAQATTLSAPPAAPTGLVAKAMKKKRVQLTWRDNSNNELGFTIEFRQGRTGEFLPLGAVSADSPGAIITGLRAKKVYEFRVYAFNKSSSSGYSNIAQAKARKQSPKRPTGPRSGRALLVSAGVAEAYSAMAAMHSSASA